MEGLSEDDAADGMEIDSISKGDDEETSDTDLSDEEEEIVEQDRGII